MKTCDDIKTKDAWIFAYSPHPYTVMFPGLAADLFFSSEEKFLELWRRPLQEYEYLLRVQVPVDFDNWDYVPADY